MFEINDLERHLQMYWLSYLVGEEVRTSRVIHTLLEFGG